MRRITQTALQHRGVARARHPIGQHPGPGQIRLVMLHAKRQGPESAHHGRSIDHGQHRQLKTPGQIGGTGFAIEQAHDALHQYQIGNVGGSGQSGTAVGLTIHPQIEVVNRCPTCQCMPVGI